MDPDHISIRRAHMWTVIGIILGLAVIVWAAFIFTEKAPVLSSAYSIGVTTDDTPNFEFVSSKAGTISYSGDCKSSITQAVEGKNTIAFNSLSDGTHSNCGITVTSGDKTSTVLNVIKFTVDKTSPSTTADLNGYSTGNLARSVTITLSCSDSASGCSGDVHYKINSGTEQRGSTVMLSSEGTYTVEYWSKDNAGNEETHKKISNIKIYSREPDVTIDTKSGTYDQSFDLKYSPAYEDDTCYYTINGGSEKEKGDCSGVFNDVSFSSDGTYVLMVYEVTEMGKSDKSNSITIDWNTGGPSVSITFPESGEEYTKDDDGDRKIKIDADSDAETCEYSTDGDDWDEFDDCDNTGVTLSDIFDTDDDKQKLYVRAVDEDGNEGDEVSVKFYYTD